MLLMCPPRAIYYSEVLNFSKEKKKILSWAQVSLVNAYDRAFPLHSVSQSCLSRMRKVSFDKLEAYLKFSNSEPLSRNAF